MVAELVVYRRIISAEERAAARKAVAPWLRENDESGGSFRLNRAWLTPLVLPEKLPMGVPDGFPLGVARTHVL